MPESKGKGRKKSSAPIDSQYGHLQPQALEIEDVVLGALMIDKDAFSIVSEIIRPETFYEPRNQKIFTAIRHLNMNERPVDILTVTEELKREGTLEDVGGGARIVEFSRGFVGPYRVSRQYLGAEIPGSSAHYVCRPDRE